MHDGEALLKAICANPDEDTPRLAYADWLEEHGEPERAEFIRVECELAKLEPETRDDPACWCDLIAPSLPCCDVCQGHEDKVEELRQRSAHLQAIPARKWAGIPIQWQMGFTFSRGFLDSITCSAATWLAHHAALYGRHPIREVNLTTSPYARLGEEWGITTDAGENAFRSTLWPTITFHLLP